MISHGTTCSCCLSSQPWVSSGKDKLPVPFSCCKEWQSTPQSSLLKTEQTQFSASIQRLLVSPAEHLGVPQSSMSVPDFTSHLTTEILLLNEGLTQLRDHPKQYSAASSTVCCRRLFKCHTTLVYSVFWTAHIQSQN